MSQRTLDQINERILDGTVRVRTVQEIKEMAVREGIPKTYEQTDVITTGTFEAMEGSGAILNLGHTDPPIRLAKAWLNDVEVYCGFGAVDLFLGAAQPATRESGPMETEEWQYGGGHVIEQLIAGKEVRFRGIGSANDCYPRKSFETTITKDSINQFYLFNPRNAYQNFLVGVNGGERTLYTYLGTLQNNLGNAVYGNAGAISPLLNDPELEVVGIGTRIFLGGGVGYIAWEGTQHFPLQKRLPNGTPLGPAATLALIGDAKHMQSAWVRGCHFHNYGTSVMLGVGIPLPVLSPKVIERAAVPDSEIMAPVVDFSIPRRVRPTFGLVSYAQLKSGSITIQGKKIKTAPVSSLFLAQKVAEELKQWIEKGAFTLTEPVAPLPMDRTFLPQDAR